MKKKITNLRYKRSKKQKKNVKKGKTYKKYKGGKCDNLSNCFFIKGHGKKKRSQFKVPHNIELFFYSIDGYCSPAWYNDIRDVCYDIGLQELRQGDAGEYVPPSRGEPPSMCYDYEIRGISGDTSGYYAAPIAGLYQCPGFYANYTEQLNVQTPKVRIYQGEMMLLSDLVSRRDIFSDLQMNKVNILFCRGDDELHTNRFYKQLAGPLDYLFTQEYNQDLARKFNTNMGYI